MELAPNPDSQSRTHITSTQTRKSSSLDVSSLILVNLLNEELRSFATRLAQIKQMRNRNTKFTLANCIAIITEHPKTVSGIVRNAPVVLFILGIAEENHASNLATDSWVQVTDGRGDQGRTLAVITILV